MKRAKNKSNLNIIADYISGNRPFSQFGYQAPTEKKHKNGDIWKDKNGIEWIQIGNTKISKKLHDRKESTRQICPSCNKDIFWGGNNYDEKFFNKTGKCYDCVINEETKMRLYGNFEIYEKIKVIKNQHSFLIELKQKIEESINWLKNKNNKIEYINEDGSIETWSDISIKTFMENAEKDLVETNKSIVLCNESIKTLESEVNESKIRRN
jgi:hypothetical protein